MSAGFFSAGKRPSRPHLRPSRVIFCYRELHRKQSGFLWHYRHHSIFMFFSPWKNCLKWPQMGPAGFFPTNPDLAYILGRTDSDFENFIFYFLGSQISEAWAPRGPTHFGPHVGPPTLGPTWAHPLWAPRGPTHFGSHVGPPTLGPRGHIMLHSCHSADLCKLCTFV